MESSGSGKILANRLKIFCDFDGTITKEDVGDRFFLTFTKGKARPLISQWENKEIDSRSMYLQEIALLDVTPEQLESFLKNQEIDPTFPEFVRFCEREGLSVTILSDGMDLYIYPILKWNQLETLTVYCNKMYWNGEGKLEVEFPYFDHSCGRCANCKGYQIRRLRAPKDHVAFIGDGLSDICALAEAETIFARGTLANYCEENNIAFMPFQNFTEILHWVDEYIQSN